MEKFTKPINRAHISKCNKSNIVEAWALLMGPGYAINTKEIRDQAGIVSVFAKKKIPGLTEDKTAVIHPTSGQVSMPFWLKQFSWDNFKRKARVGRRFLSVHRICSIPDDRYDRFNSEILTPMKKIWTPIFEDAILTKEDLEITRIMAGYSNRFSIPLKDFSISKLFNFGLHLEVLQRPLTPGGFNCTFELNNPTEGVISGITITVTPPNSEESDVVVQTSVQSEMILKEPALYESNHWERQLIAVQKSSKLNFYGLCTDKCLEEQLDVQVGK